MPEHSLIDSFCNAQAAADFARLSHCMPDTLIEKMAVLARLPRPMPWMCRSTMNAFALNREVLLLCPDQWDGHPTSNPHPVS